MARAASPLFGPPLRPTAMPIRPTARPATCTWEPWSPSRRPWTSTSSGLPDRTWPSPERLQDYGAYIVDSGGCNFQLFAEPKAKDEAAQIKVEPSGQSYYSLRKLVPFLRIVTNNGPQSVGGGGTPRRPLGAPFSNRAAQQCQSP